jgi:hypothetical protein
MTTKIIALVTATFLLALAACSSEKDHGVSGTMSATTTQK